jgi:hypothetical protein
MLVDRFQQKPAGRSNAVGLLARVALIVSRVAGTVKVLGKSRVIGVPVGRAPELPVGVSEFTL